MRHSPGRRGRRAPGSHLGWTLEVRAEVEVQVQGGRAPGPGVTCARAVRVGRLLALCRPSHAGLLHPREESLQRHGRAGNFATSK
ncbi:unnamed protein product [Rangifer tarandus platyrhynchus]|uniref:Uncharacterized protein n=1 Tax=Rangifer tarandus platyrhynchus TaxID=3082113 RepID=A0AC59Y7Y0_RANTA